MYMYNEKYILECKLSAHLDSWGHASQEAIYQRGKIGRVRSPHAYMVVTHVRYSE